MNFIFISPNFPETYWHFCQGLKNNKVTVLGIGDSTYDELLDELKDSLTEYYKVSTLDNYEEVRKGCEYFQKKYGKIDWLESNNEYWLLQDAALRTDLNINSGLHTDNVSGIKYKSAMKMYYEKAGVKTARYHLIKDYEGCMGFILKVGYPVIVKPDNGVGASSTYKLSNQKEFDYFFETKAKIQYIMEEFVQGNLLSYDGIAGKNKEIIFETAHGYPVPIMDIVNNQKDVVYYSYRVIPEDLRDAGRRVIEAFETNSRFFHCEFFRMTADKGGLGNKGDIIGLEVNMRAPGGYTPDMMNFANDVDVYQIWANMIAYNKGDYHTDRPYYCVSAARRDGNIYAHSISETVEKYNTNITMKGRMPEALAAAMGNDMIIARFKNFDKVEEFVNFYLSK